MRKFTKQEDQFLRDNYLTMPAKTMSRHLGRSESVTRQRMAVLGLKVPLETIALFKAQSRFKKGNVPANAGKSWNEFMSNESQNSCRKTTFKKGNKPHNTKYDGAERVSKDGYREIRVSLGKYRLLHRVNWEKINGPVPNGMALVTKDGNKLNCSPSNWELISRADLMRRNSLHNYPKEISSTYQLIGALNRKINKLSNEKQN